jgi:hypothetical protein
MWFLVATMLVMGHHVKIHVEGFPTQKECEARKAYVEEVSKQYGAVIKVVCLTEA